MRNQSIKPAILLYLKGIAMGMGDSVPGVSGGTIAVITHIYEKLINSIRRVDVEAFKMFFQGKFKDLWLYIDGNFLLLLGAGILSGLLLSANTVLFLLENFFEPLMGFFIGLVLASTWFLLSQTQIRKLPNLAMAILGLTLAIAISTLPAQSLNTDYLSVFLSGAVAICAMILPGLSGAFILLILGLYEFILTALTQFQIDYIVVFGAGCAVGLMGFSRVLNWLLNAHHQKSYGFITGLLLGSVSVLWPWQMLETAYTDSSGDLHPLVQSRLSPFEYLELTQADPRILSTLIALAVGVLLIVVMQRVSAKPDDIGSPI